MMTQEAIENMLDETGIQYRYHHFETAEAIPPPFICWLLPGSDNFSADNRVYARTDELDIELYTDRKDTALEEQIEAVLDAHGIFWNKQEFYIETEKMYEVLYEMEV